MNMLLGCLTVALLLAYAMLWWLCIKIISLAEENRVLKSSLARKNSRFKQEVERAIDDHSFNEGLMPLIIFCWLTFTVMPCLWA